VSPEAGVSKSVLGQLFPEINFGTTTTTQPEEVEKPDETTPTTPTNTGVTAVGADETVPGSELQKYNLEGKLTYGAPFNIQVGPSGPQGRGSRLGYSGSTATAATTPAATTTESSVALPKYEMPEIDLSPYESALAESQSIISGLSQQLSDIMGAYQKDTSGAQMDTGTTTPPTGETGGGATGDTGPQAPTQPLRLQIQQAAAAGGKDATSLGKTGVKNLLAQGADVSQFEKQAKAAGVSLGQKAQGAIDRAQVQAIAQAPASLGTQVQQIAKATESGKITQAAVRSLIESGTSAKQIEKVAAKQGVEIGKQAQKLIEKAQEKKKNK
jgi:hypothetical protein